MRIEHLDDLPLLGDQLMRCDLSTHLDNHFPDHGHWQGISGGKVAVGWLLYILSDGDHRLSHVEEWAGLRLQTLGAILEEEQIRRLDFCDDRLGRLLDRYSEDEAWTCLERSLGQSLLEIYELKTSESSPKDELTVVRTDSFNAPQYREKEGLFAYGHSKQRRSDLPFCKVMMAALDPLSLPIAVEIINGGGPDTDHYLPVIERAQAILKQSGNLYVGDSQLGSKSNRLSIHQAGDYYLCPLNRKQCLLEQLHNYLDQIPGPLTDLPGLFTETDANRKPAYYYEIKETMQVEQGLPWEERRILVYSPEYAQGLITSFNSRLDKAEAAIRELVIHKPNRRNPKTLADLQTRIGSLINSYRVEDCFEIICSQTIEEYPIRKSKKSPEGIQKKIKLELNLERKEITIELKQKRLGWQIYGTNAPVERITTADLVKCYRNEYRIEHLFDYIINRDVGLLPIFLKKEERIKGLVRLLSLAMRFSGLIQYQIRVQLAKTESKLRNVYPGNKNRSTPNPTTPMLLRAFRGIGIAWVDIGSQQIIQMTDLTPIQNTILELLGATQVYYRTLEWIKTHSNLRET